MTTPIRYLIALVVIIALAAVFAVCYAGFGVFEWLWQRSRAGLSRRVAEVADKHDAGVAANRARLEQVRDLLKTEPEWAGQCWRMQ